MDDRATIQLITVIGVGSGSFEGFLKNESSKTRDTKKYPLILCLLFLTVISFANQTYRDQKHRRDTMPEICNYLPPGDIDALRPFTNTISGNFPDPNNYEVYNGCHYQFFAGGDKPQLAVRLLKWSTKLEALDDYNMQVRRHFESWGISPEKLTIGADSCYFGIEPMELNKCDECGLVVLQGFHTIYISFKGQYDKTTRDWKKKVSLDILKMMYDRIPGLAPSIIRNRQ